MSGVTVFCFWASYAVAFSLEVSRLLFHSRVRHIVLLSFGGAGLLAHTIVLINKSMDGQPIPLSSLHDWLLVLAWTLSAFYLYLTICYHTIPLGVFLLPIVLGLVTWAGWFVEPSPHQLQQWFWGILHGGLVLLGSVAVVASCLAGAMYLVQSWRLKSNRTFHKNVALPNLELLQRINHGSLMIAFGLLTLGFGSGIILAIARNPDSLSDLIFDPTFLAAIFVWSIFGFLLFLQHSRELGGRKDALLTIMAFAFLMLILPVIYQMEKNNWHRGTNDSRRDLQTRFSIDADGPMPEQGGL